VEIVLKLVRFAAEEEAEIEVAVVPEELAEQETEYIEAHLDIQLLVQEDRSFELP